MRIKEVCLLILVFLASSVYATESPDASLDPVSVYEANEIEFSLLIDNIGGNKIIEEIKADMNSFVITDMRNYNDWTESFNGSVATWTGGDIEDNVMALFRFTAESGLVDQDENVSVDITMTKDNNQDEIKTLNIMILNDNTPPSLSGNTPSDGDFLSEGVTDQLISVNAIDNETGIKDVEFTYWDCSANATNVTIDTVSLNCNNSICSTSLDLSSSREGDLMCFEFAAENNALETAAAAGTVGFDNTPPAVELISPSDSAVGSEDVLFSFKATDNLDPLLSCDLLIDDVITGSAAAANGNETSIVYTNSLAEGNYIWKVRCEDGVRLNTESSERTIFLGNGPAINLNIDEIERTKPYTISFEVTDETAVDDVSLIFKGSEINLTKNGNSYTGILNTDVNDALGNQSVNVIANDTLGFVSDETFVFTLVRGYDIELNLSKTSVEPGKEVIVSGAVSLDDGGSVPEDNITLYLPDSSVNVPTDDLDYTFNAPSSEGIYTIRAVVVSADGFEHEASVNLEVKRISAKSSSSGSSGNKKSSSPRVYCGDASCQSAVEDCKTCPIDCGECVFEEELLIVRKPEKSFFDINKEPEEPSDSGITGAFIVDGIPAPPLKNVVTNPIVIALALMSAPGLCILPFRKRFTVNKSGLVWDGYFEKHK